MCEYLEIQYCGTRVILCVICNTCVFFLLYREKQPMASLPLEAEALVGPSKHSRTEGGSSAYSWYDRFLITHNEFSKPWMLTQLQKQETKGSLTGL